MKGLPQQPAELPTGSQVVTVAMYPEWTSAFSRVVLQSHSHEGPPFSCWVGGVFFFLLFFLTALFIQPAVCRGVVLGGTTVPPTVTTVQAAEGENAVGGGAKAEKLSGANVKKNKMDHSGQGPGPV